MEEESEQNENFEEYSDEDIISESPIGQTIITNSTLNSNSTLNLNLTSSNGNNTGSNQTELGKKHEKSADDSWIPKKLQFNTNFLK